MQKLFLCDFETLYKNRNYRNFTFSFDDNLNLFEDRCIAIEGLFTKLDFYFNPDCLVFKNNDTKLFIKAIDHIEKTSFETKYRDFFIIYCSTIENKTIKYTFSASK